MFGSEHDGHHDGIVANGALTDAREEKDDELEATEVADDVGSGHFGLGLSIALASSCPIAGSLGQVAAKRVLREIILAGLLVSHCVVLGAGLVCVRVQYYCLRGA